MSENDGPAVNEFEFINSLFELDSSQYVIFIKENSKLNKKEMSTNIIWLTETPRLSQIGKWLRRFWFVHQNIKNEKVNVLVCRLTDFPLVPLLLKVFNPKVKIAIKTAALWWVGRYPLKEIRARAYLKISDFMTRRVYKRADAIDVAMLETRNSLISLGLSTRTNTILIDNAINTKMFSPNAPILAQNPLIFGKNSIVLGFAGSLPSERGAYQILKVAECLASTFQNLYVLIVGDDPDLEKMVRNSSFPREKIILPGIVPYTEVSKYINAMTVCYSFFEPGKIKLTGNASQKVKQYISMGKPVISCATGHNYLKEKDLGSPVDQENIQEIVEETIKWIHRVERERDSLSTRLHNYAKEHLSTEVTFQQRLAFWHALFKDEECTRK